MLNVVIPDKFNVDKKVVAPFNLVVLNVVVSDTFNELLIVVILFDVVFPETVNVDIHVISYVPFVYKAPLKTVGNLVVTIR